MSSTYTMITFGGRLVLSWAETTAVPNRKIARLTRLNMNCRMTPSPFPPSSICNDALSMVFSLEVVSKRRASVSPAHHEQARRLLYGVLKSPLSAKFKSLGHAAPFYPEGVA